MCSNVCSVSCEKIMSFFTACTGIFATHHFEFCEDLGDKVANIVFLFNNYFLRIASGGWDKRLIVWDIQTGTILVRLVNCHFITI